MEADKSAIRSVTPLYTELMVSSQEVKGVPGMFELIESIRTYISPSVPMNGKENVAIIFAAVLSALRASDIQTKQRDNQTQYFSYMYRGEGYRVSLPSDVLLSVLHKWLTHRLGLRRFVSRRRPLECQPLQSLQRLKEHRRTNGTVEEQKGRDMQELQLKKLEGARRASIEAEHEGPSTFTATAVRDVLGQLLDRENDHRAATQRVYEAYAQLVCCFVKLVAQNGEGSPPSPETKVFHQTGFAIMERAMEGWIRGAELSQSALIKRLKQARKIFLLVRCFGEQVLGDDALTMRLVDRTTFQSFSVLLSSTVLSSGKETDDMVVSLSAIGDLAT